MGKLTINANDTENASTIQVRYRVLNSGATYAVLNKAPGQMPVVINGLADAQYEVGVRNLCVNGKWSDWVTSQTSGCPLPLGFGVTKAGGNFVVNASLVSPATKIQVLMTDPNGGQLTFNQDLGGQSGNFNIAVPSGIYGDYTFSAKTVCDNTVSPIYASVSTADVSVNVANPTPVNQVFNFTNGNGNADMNLNVLFIDDQYQSGGVTVPKNTPTPTAVNTPYTGTATSVVKLVVSGFTPATSQLNYGVGGAINGIISGTGPFNIVFNNVDLTVARNITVAVN
jgi:hypothetical protein